MATTQMTGPWQLEIEKPTASQTGKMFQPVWFWDAKHQNIIFHTNTETEADMALVKLIYAAPDLLVACEFALSVIKANFPVETSEFLAIDKLEKAIAKAKGG